MILTRYYNIIAKFAFIIGLFLILFSKSDAQITKLQDYQNLSSNTIGTYRGKDAIGNNIQINFREAGFSGLYPIPGTNGTEFWTCSDRGVNVDCDLANPSSCRPTYNKMYAFPNYAPKIHRIKINSTTGLITILQTITIKRPNGLPATGLLNPTGLGSTVTEVNSTDTVLDCANFNLKTAAKDTFGIDCEGIVVDKQGNFWLCEEGAASIWKLNPNGTLIKRYTPFGNRTDGSVRSVDFPIDTAFGYRNNNRGFEGIAISPSGKIYGIIQSPLFFPTSSVGQNSRIHRILEIDPATDAMREFAYVNDGVIGTSSDIRLRDWKIGDLAAISDTTFLVLEAAARGAYDIKRMYKINISGATPITSTGLIYGGQSLENLYTATVNNLPTYNITPVTKTLVMDLLANGWPSILDKAEGLAILNDSTIAICNDNDYGQSCILTDGIPVETSNTSHLVTYKLSGPNKLPGYTSPFPTPSSNIDYSFVVLGCNRVESWDSINNVSSANLYQLNRVFTEITQMNPLPKYLFFAGDMVLGYVADTVALAKQLSGWLAVYNSHPIKNTSVQLVAIPGNHETQNKAAGKLSFIAAERTYQRIMGNYMIGSNGPGITGITAGTDSLTTDQSKLTYSFDYKNDHFVVIDTDPVGRDGKAPYYWIGSDIAAARAKGARHVFAVGHKPAYSGRYTTPPNGLDNFPPQRDLFWKALESQQVDAYFSAHVHASDTIQPTVGKTWQVIAGNGGSLVEAQFQNPIIKNGQTSYEGSFFGYVLVNVFNNDSVNVLNLGRDAVMTSANFADATPDNPTTVRGSYNINVNPIINHIPFGTTSSNGPFTLTANITDNIAVTNALLNYSVNGIPRNPINPTISGSTYTFVIPAEQSWGVINYNIQANDVSGVKVYSNNLPNAYNSFNFGQSTIKGAGSSQTPYVTPVQYGNTFTSIISAGDTTNGGYKMVGIPDGLGAFDNGNGTFTLLVNHEISAPAGVNRAHGNNSAFVSKWIINKSDLSVVSGSDLIRNVNLWNGSGYTLYKPSDVSTLKTFSRFCSADLPQISAFYNSKTGLGTQERIFMNGEETGSEGRAFAHIVTGINAGTSYELPFLGKASFENQLANPTEQDKTVVAGTDDTTPGQVYIYVGTKTSTGTEIDKAGLTNGKLYGIAVSGLTTEVSASFINPNTPFSLVDVGAIQNKTGAYLDSISIALGITRFLRPEDAAWDPSNPNDLYFVTTNAFNSPSRMYRARFNDIKNPLGGGTITAVLDGTEGQQMMDNIGIDNAGHIMILEDVGNNAHNGKVWQYTISNDKLTQIAQHDSTRFISGGSKYLTQDEETSGIIDVQNILGAGNFLLVDQAHYAISGEVYEGGQILRLFNQNFANSIAGAAPSSSQSPYIQSTQPGVTFNSILTAGDSTSNGYKMVGVPDGTGAFDNGNGTFTLLVNHELNNTVGINRVHGGLGAFVSKWIINKNDLSVVSGSDLIQKVNLWNGTSYTLYNPTDATPLKSFSRFCSADLPEVSAYFNSKTGLGTTERIFMNGEETGNEGRGFAHIVTGVNAGTSYELPALGKFSIENLLANPAEQDKTVVAGTDDSTPGQVYIYVGTKTNFGTEIDKAGLTNGKLYGISVSGLSTEVSGSIPNPNTNFSLVDLGVVTGITGTQLNTNSNLLAITTFLRPEDAAWDPSNPNDLYFATTNAFGSPSRLWRARFSDIKNPTAGGTITAVLDGTEGQQMFDNISIDNSGNIILLEDVGNNAHNGKVWQYKIATDQLTQIGQHDPSRFIAGGANFLTQDEETSGIIDVSKILGTGNYLLVDQAHYTIPGEIAEGGQILRMYAPGFQSLNVPSYPVINHCATSATSFTVNFNTSVNINSNNEFQLQLSDALGNFTNPKIIGRNANYSPTSIIGTLPVDLGPGNYRLRVVTTSPFTVSNESGNTVLVTGSLTVPYIVNQPVGATVCAATNYTLNYTVNGSPNLLYQWYKDDKAISGATLGQFTLANTSFAMSGDYYCIASETINGCLYALKSKVTSVYISGSSSITDQPVSTWTSPGGTIKLEANAHLAGYKSTNPPTVQWFRNFNQVVDDYRISGSKSNVLMIQNVQASDTSGDYYVLFTSSCGNVLQSNRVKIGLANLTLSAISNVTKCEGDSLVLISNASSNQSLDIVYQWMFNGKPILNNNQILGSNSNKLVIKNLSTQNSGTYSLNAKAKNSNLNINTNQALVNINTKPVITKMTQSTLTVQLNKDLTLSVVANGTAPIAYQWYKDDLPISGANTDTYTKTGVATIDAGSYFVWVKNMCDSVKSNTTIVTTVAAGMTSVFENGINNSIKLIPNPASTKAILKFESPILNAKIVINDALGNSIIIANDVDIQSEFLIDFDKFNLSSSNYQLTIQSNNLIYNLPFVLIK